MEDLPEGWTEVPLEQLTDPTCPISYGVLKPGPVTPGGIPMLRVKDVRRGLIDRSDLLLISKELHGEYRRTHLKRDDVVISVQGSVGRVAIVPPELGGSNISRTLAVVRPSNPELSPWIWLALQAPQVQAALEEATGGTTRDSLNIRDLRVVGIRVPPLAEQKRIVEKVEALLAQVQAARDRLERVQQILKRFRQAVLAAACKGLLNDRGREISTATGLPNGWNWMRVADLLQEGGIFDGPFGSNLKSSDYTTAGVRVIRLENLANLEFVAAKETYISVQKYKGLTRHTVGAGDVIFGSFVDGPSRVCVLPELPTLAIAKADCFCLRPNPGRMLSGFLALQLSSQQTRDTLIAEIHGATRPRITTRQLRDLEVPVCGLEEQREVLEAVERHLGALEVIRKRIAGAAAVASRAPESILSKAFSGELVPTEASLARVQGQGFESGEELLEQVRANSAGDRATSHRAGAARRRASLLGRGGRR